MVVWLVRVGEKHDTVPVAVFRTREKATERALCELCHFDGGWVNVVDSATVATWHNGCDEVNVSAWEVIE